MPQEAETQYYKALEHPASGNSRDQNKENHFYLEMKKSQGGQMMIL